MENNRRHVLGLDGSVISVDHITQIKPLPDDNYAGVVTPAKAVEVNQQQVEAKTESLLHLESVINTAKQAT